MSLPVSHHVRPEKKHCFAELPTPTNTGLPLCQMNFRIPVQGMLFGRKLGSHWLDGAVQLFYSFVRSCSSFSKMLPSASVLRGLALLEIWEAFPVLPFTFALKAPQALNLNRSYTPLTHPLTHFFAHDCITDSQQLLTHMKNFVCLQRVHFLQIVCNTAQVFVCRYEWPCLRLSGSAFGWLRGERLPPV